MRIGVVSDTHNNLLNCARIVELFNESGVERVVHTGDITQAKTVEVFADLRPSLFGVFGNNDLERASLEGAIKKHGFEFGGFGDVSVDFDSINFVHGSQWFWSKICPESAKSVV